MSRRTPTRSAYSVRFIPSIKGWSSENLEARLAVYWFKDFGALNALTLNGILGNLVTKFDERWQGKVTRTGEIVDDKQGPN